MSPRAPYLVGDVNRTPHQAKQRTDQVEQRLKQTSSPPLGVTSTVLRDKMVATLRYSAAHQGSAGIGSGAPFPRVLG
jgi:hypothetical protein